jgi:hypothetical protein
MKRLALSIVIVLVILVGTVEVSQSAGPAAQSIPAQLRNLQNSINALSAKVEPRRFYLTAATHTGASAQQACESGFHMASLYEILDPTALKYGAKTPGEAFYQPDPNDQGSGPPVGSENGAYGWVRTGGTASSALPVSGFPGTANCDAWTREGPPEDPGWGTFVYLNPEWSATYTPDAPRYADWWRTNVTVCNDTGVHVWCVEDR